MPSEQAIAKDRSGPISTLPLPGEELAEEIERGLAEGRPGVRIGKIPGSRATLGVPQTRLFRIAENGALVFPKLPPLESVVSERLALALEAPRPLAFERLGAHDWAAGRRLYAAALRDLAGLSEDEIAKACGFKEAETFGDPRNARDAVSRGRRTWHQMGAWPWSHLHPNGRPPANWRRDGPNSNLTTVFATWQTGHFPPRCSKGR